MSYILDALKKSDSERQQRQGPNLASVQHQQHFYRGSNRSWGMSFIAGLVIALACALLWLYQMGYLSISMPEAQNTTIAKAAVEPSQPASTDTSTEAGIAAAVATEVAANPPAQAIAPASNAAPAAVEDVGPQGNLRELWQLPSALRAGIPALEFSLHVYSGQRDQRSIIINNRMMREGEFVNPELLLHTITPDGVVMRYRNEYFRVSIVDSW